MIIMVCVVLIAHSHSYVRLWAGTSLPTVKSTLKPTIPHIKRICGEVRCVRTYDCKQRFREIVILGLLDGSEFCRRTARGEPDWMFAADIYAAMPELTFDLINGAGASSADGPPEGQVPSQPFST